MTRSSTSVRRLACSAAALFAFAAACSDNTVTNPTLAGAFTTTTLVADQSSVGATTVDPNLQNAWGLAFSTTGTLWVSNNHTGTSTLYDSLGVRRTLVVTVPTATSSTGGTPTGIVFNPTTDFVIPGSTKAAFIFSTEDGTISAWNSGTAAVVVANRSSAGAVYKGLALANNGSANFLYATNFKGNKVDVFDKTYTLVSSFTDPNIPSGYGPFGIATINGQLYVTFAKQAPPDNTDDAQGVGNGYVDVFNLDGTVAKRFASRGTLNSPWGVALAPAGFGSAAGDILVGNFGDGHIGAYDATTGAFKGLLRDANGASLTIPGLWALTLGPTPTGTTMFFSAGPDDETHGVVGILKPM